eukprot:464706_1
MDFDFDPYNTKKTKKEKYTNVTFETKDELQSKVTELIHNIISKNGLNISLSIIKQVLNELNKLSLSNATDTFNKFNKHFKELRAEPARTGLGWSYKNDYKTDLKIALKETFHIEIRNYYNDTYYYTNSIKLPIKLIEEETEVDYHKQYKKCIYMNNIFTLDWISGHILYSQKHFLSNDLKTKLYKHILPLINKCNDCTYPNAERKETKKKQPELEFSFYFRGVEDTDDTLNDERYSKYKYHDICIKHIIDPLLNNFGHKYWIPSILSIDENNNCKFVTEIPNLPRLHYEHVYPVFEKILSAIIPKFEWILGCDLKMKCIQIITDIQHYIVKSNTYYNGNWHREGFKNGEFIQCGAIYYFNKTENFFETDVFEIKSKGHRTCAGDFLAKYNINIDENNLIIFDNESSIHRLNTLTSVKRDNDEKDVGYRSHILFLIPKYKINSMRDFNVNTHYMYPDVLNYWIREHGIEYFPMPLKKVILKNMNVCDSGWSDIIKQRNDARKLRMNVGKWMNIDLGATN